ncbi:MAG TPA: GNAT family N-acetyltransferase [Pyrinomonadaceae bacterium]|nr:GNAT family N-acetyltransferase [Pyrinomonadaceae bacterium]
MTVASDHPVGDLQVGLRPANDNDREFLLQVYQISREIELSMTPWDDAQKRAFAEHQLDAQTYTYRVRYPNAAHDIVLYDGQTAGRIYVDRGDREISILDITVIHEFRRKGIGTSLVTGLQKEAGESNRSVSIYIEPFNPSQKLFGGLGFKVVPDEGVDLRFEWKGDVLSKNI